MSYSNQLNAKVISVENATVLSSIVLSIGSFIFESIITLETCKQMDLQPNDSVIALINANEIDINEVES